MNKIDYIVVMVLMVILSGCNSLFDKEIPEYQVSDATAVTDQASAETALLVRTSQSSGQSSRLWMS